MSSHTVISQYRAQQQMEKIDSLESMLAVSEGEERIDMLNHLAEMYIMIAPELTLEYSKESLARSLELNYKRGEAKSYLNRGSAFGVMSMPIEATGLIFKALGISEEIGDDELIGDVYFALAFNYFLSLSDLDKVKEYAVKAMGIYESIGEKEKRAQLYLAFIGLNNIYYNQPTEALYYFDRFNEIGQQIQISRIRRAIATASAGDSYFSLGNFPKTLELYQNAMSIYDTSIVEEKALYSQNFIALSSYCYQIGALDSAKRFAYEGIRLSRSISHSMGLMSVYSHLGTYYEAVGLGAKAVAAYDSCIFFADHICRTGYYYSDPEYYEYVGNSFEVVGPFPAEFRKQRARGYMVRAYRRLALIHESAGRIDLALENYRLFDRMKDSADIAARDQEIRETRFRFETGKKDLQLETLASENQLRELQLAQSRYMQYGLGGLLLFIVLLAMVMIRNNHLRNIQQTLLLEQKLLRSQLNPHFIFNALASIRAFMDGKDAASANKYLNSFSRLLRNILESSREDSVPLEKELASMRSYLELQRLRYRDEFDYEVVIDERLDPESVLVPPLLTQPFLEASIEGNTGKLVGPVHVKVLIIPAGGSL